MTDTKTRPDPFGFDGPHHRTARRVGQRPRDPGGLAVPDRAARRGPGGIPWPATYVVADADALRFRTYSVEDAAHVAALDPAVATAIAETWEHQADDMADHLAHLHPTTSSWFVADEDERLHEDWTATLRAALAYLREDAPKAVASDV